ncbi:protein transport protein bos1 [Dispira simplex]|nr:protein transport protein bos1 [Dispira simplex]
MADFRYQNQRAENSQQAGQPLSKHARERHELLQRGRDVDSQETSIAMDYVYQEHRSLQYTDSAIDDFIGSAQAALENLQEQRSWLKNSRRRILDTANTLGLSRSVIHYIERRTSQDKWVFWVAVLFTIGFIWLLIHFFR